MTPTLPEHVLHMQNDLLALCRSGRLLCLYPHIHADGDALGSCVAMALALEQLGARVAILFEEAVSAKLQSLLPERGVSHLYEPGRRQTKAAAAASAALVLDCSPGGRLGARQEWVGRTENVFVIDHHVRDEQFIDDVRVWRDTQAPATCALIGAWLQDWEEAGLLKIDEEIATALMIGLLTDTGRFAYESTKPETLQLAADLLRVGAPMAALSHILFEQQSQKHLRLMGWIGSETQFLAGGRASYCVLPYSWIQQHRPEGMDFEGLAAEMRNVEGVEAALLLRARADGKYKASLRSQSCFDAQQFASRYGGGGHVRASGFEVTQQQLQGLPEAFAAAVEEALRDVEPAEVIHVAVKPGETGKEGMEGRETTDGELSETQELSSAQPLTGEQEELSIPKPKSKPCSFWKLEESPQGILNIYKPAGLSSFAVVAILRRITGIRKIGHCGTLDPFAEGVLPVCIGRATSAVAYMQEYDKTYQARVVLGSETDSGDCTGAPIEQQEVTETQLIAWNTPGEGHWTAVLESLLQEREQLPPMYSAVKHQGKPLYHLARQGIEVERKPRPIRIFMAQALQAPRRRMEGMKTGELEAEFRVSKGTYIRTLCTLLARRMGSVGHLDRLIRTSCGPFTQADSVRLEALHAENWQSFLLPTHRALPDWEKLELSAKQTKAILQGKFLPEPQESNWHRQAGQHDQADPLNQEAQRNREAETELLHVETEAEIVVGPANETPAAALFVQLFFEGRFLGIGRVTREEERWGIRAERMFTTFDTSHHE